MYKVKRFSGKYSRYLDEIGEKVQDVKEYKEPGKVTKFISKHKIPLAIAATTAATAGTAYALHKRNKKRKEAEVEFSDKEVKETKTQKRARRNLGILAGTGVGLSGGLVTGAINETYRDAKNLKAWKKMEARDKAIQINSDAARAKINAAEEAVLDKLDKIHESRRVEVRNTDDLRHNLNEALNNFDNRQKARAVAQNERNKVFQSADEAYGHSREIYNRQKSRINRAANKRLAIGLTAATAAGVGTGMYVNNKLKKRYKAANEAKAKKAEK